MYITVGHSAIVSIFKTSIVGSIHILSIIIYTTSGVGSIITQYKLLIRSIELRIPVWGFLIITVV